MSQVCDYQDTLAEHKITVIGISVDDEKRSTRFKKKLGLCFDLLCDTNRKVIEEYDVVDPQRRLGGSIALSADIIIDQHGEIIFSSKTHYSQRPKIKEVLKGIGVEV